MGKGPEFGTRVLGEGAEKGGIEGLEKPEETELGGLLVGWCVGLDANVEFVLSLTRLSLESSPVGTGAGIQSSLIRIVIVVGYLCER